MGRAGGHLRRAGARILGLPGPCLSRRDRIVLLGGVLAYHHKVSLPAALAAVAAVAGAVIGDSVGYEVGRRWRRTLLHGPAGRVGKTARLDRAEGYQAERGGQAVFLGRFTAAHRVLIPGMAEMAGLAGMAGMTYRTFAAYNVAGGTRAGLVLLLVVVLLAAAFFGARQAIRHRARIEALGRRRLARPWVAAGRRRYHRRLGFLARRFRPGGAIGLEVTLSLMALAPAGQGFGWVVTGLLSNGRLLGPALGIDRPVLDFFAGHRTGGLTDAVKVVTVLGSAGFMIPAAVLIGALARWRLATWRPLLLLGGGYAGAAALQGVIKNLVARPRPPARLAVANYGGWSFPSGHAAQAAAFWGALALVAALATPSWRRRVIAWTVALVVTALVGSSRCYLGAHWASDVLGGWALGTAWLFTIARVSQATRRARPGDRGDEVAGTESGRPGDRIGAARPYPGASHSENLSVDGTT